MSPEGVFDKKAQIRSLGSFLLYQINQGRIATGEAINEHLERLGFTQLGRIPQGFLMKDGHYEDIILLYIEL